MFTCKMEEKEPEEEQKEEEQRDTKKDMIMDDQDEMKDSFSTVRTFLTLENKKFVPFRNNDNYSKTYT